MIDGFALGVFTVENVYDMNLCIKDINPLVLDVAQAISEIKEGSYQSISDGIYTIGQSVSQVGIIMRECPNATREQDLDKLKEMGESLLHPIHLIKTIPMHLFTGGIQAWHAFQEGQKDSQAGKYEEAGKSYGEAAALILWGKPSVSSVSIGGLLQ